MEKECKYCSVDERGFGGLKLLNMDMNFIKIECAMIVQDDEDEKSWLILDMIDENGCSIRNKGSEGIEITYCPFCGRKLK